MGRAAVHPGLESGLSAILAFAELPPRYYCIIGCMLESTRDTARDWGVVTTKERHCVVFNAWRG